ncbi:MAG: flagellar hook-length control protein FliK [Acetobacteraceae bacterium]
MFGIFMLDPASVSQINAPATSAAAAKARSAEGDDAGFQDRLRDALQTDPADEAVRRSGPAAKPSEGPQLDQREQEAGQQAVRPASAESVKDLAELAKELAEPPTELAGPAKEVAEPPTELVAPAKENMQAAAARDAASATGAEVLPLDSKDTSASALLSGLSVIQIPPKLPEQAILMPAQAGMAALPSAAAAQAEPGVVQTEAHVTQRALASVMLQESAQEQGQVLANALAAGPTQALAAQATQNGQANTGAAKSAPVTIAQEALEAAKPMEAHKLLSEAFNKSESAVEMKLVMAAETAEASWRLASFEAPKATSAKPFGEARAEGLSVLPQGFAPTDVMPQSTDGPLPSAAARDLPAPMPARQLAPVVVSLALGRGDEALTIALDPGELGRVEVSIGQGKEAGQLRIVAERPETLALLQRDQRELDRALNQAGLGDMARSLSFSLASDQQRQQQAGAEERGQRRASFTIGGVEGEGAMPNLPAPLRNATSLIDIAV